MGVIEHMIIDNKRTQNHVVLLMFLILTISGFYIYSQIDIPSFNIPWATQIANNKLNIYSGSISPKVDYPPLLPLIFGIIGALIKLLNHFFSLPAATIYFLQNGLLKMPAIIVLTFFTRFFITRSRDSLADAKAFSTIFTYLLTSLSIFFNAIVWGQVDVILIAEMFFAFYFLVNERINVASFFLVLGIVTKLQAVYFVPIFVVYAIRYFKNNQWLQGLLTGCIVFTTVWAPFAFVNRNLLLPFQIYLKGSSSYPVLNAGAFNFWGAIDPRKLERVTSIHKDIFGMLLFSWLNYLILLSILIIALVLILLNKQNLFIGGLIYTLAIFTFSMSQHERYEMTVLPFVLLALLYSNSPNLKKAFGHIWISLDCIIFLNMAYIYTYLLHVIGYSTILVRLFSIVSVAISLSTIVFCCRQVQCLHGSGKLFYLNHNKNVNIKK